MWITEIEHVAPQRLVVRPDVECHRQAGLWIDAGARGVERQLADRDAHAVGAQIAEPQDALAVGDDDDADVFLRPVGEDSADPPAIGRGDEEASRFPGDVRERLARLTDRRRVDDRQDPIDVGEHSPVEEPFVPLLQRRQQHVSVDIPRQPLQVLEHPLRHLFRRRHTIRQQPRQAQTIPVLPAEGDGSVERLIAQDVEAAPHRFMFASRGRWPRRPAPRP